MQDLNALLHLFVFIPSLNCVYFSSLLHRKNTVFISSALYFVSCFFKQEDDFQFQNLQT